MSLPNEFHCRCVCDQVRPIDSQYKDYKRSGDSFWSKLEPVKMDTAKLEHLFETKSKEMPVTKVNNQRGFREIWDTGLQSHCMTDLTYPTINHNGV